MRRRLSLWRIRSERRWGGSAVGGSPHCTECMGDLVIVCCCCCRKHHHFLIPMSIIIMHDAIAGIHMQQHSIAVL